VHDFHKKLTSQNITLKKKLQNFSAVISHLEMSIGQRRTIPALCSRQHKKYQASLIHFLFIKPPVRPTFLNPKIQKMGDFERFLRIRNLKSEIQYGV